MAWWEVLATVAGVCTGIGVIYKFLTDWGGKLVQKMAKYGVKDELETMQKSIKENTEVLRSIKEELDANTRLTLKLELKSLFLNHPDEAKVIELTMDKYRSLHGDSYIDTLYEVWKEENEKKNVRKQIGGNKKKS